MSKVAIIHRAKMDARRSIEGLFKTIDQLSYIQRLELPCDLNSVKNIVKLLTFSIGVKPRNIHITGDVHYAQLFMFWKRGIVTVHDAYHHAGLKGIRKFIQGVIWFRLPLALAKKIVVISPTIKESLIDLFNINPEKITIIPNAIHLKNPLGSFNKRPIFTVLMIGTKQNKNLQNLSKAIGGIENVQLLIIGKLNTNQTQDLVSNKVNYINKYNLTDDELIHEYKTAHVLFMASFQEGFGLPILEAQELGLPVVTSNLGPMDYVAGNAAVLVDPHSTEAIKSAILSIKTNKQKADDLIQKGFTNVKRFSMDTYTASYEALYKDVFKL